MFSPLLYAVLIEGEEEFTAFYFYRSPKKTNDNNRRQKIALENAQKTVAVPNWDAPPLQIPFDFENASL